MTKRFEGKVVMVTGASRGIGEAIACGFAEEGAKVALLSRKQEALDGVAAKIEEKGGEAFAFAYHLGKPETAQQAVEAIKEKFGRIDVLVNNAATNPIFGPSMFAEEKAFDKIFAVNVKGPFFLSKQVLAVFQELGGGAIVNVASVAAFKPAPMIGIYSVSKTALVGLSRMMAAEWAPFNVRVNTVCPGLIKTQFSRAIWDSDDALKYALEGQKIKKLAEPKDVVGAILYLASDEAAFVTGQEIMVDGGSLI